jgi:DNA-binding response OmpR family regulator
MNNKTNNTTQTKILLIGSVPKITDSIKSLLESNNHTVELIPSISAFEASVEKNRFDVIVGAADSSKFSTENLFELASLLTPETPVIGYSSSPEPTGIMDFIRFGGVDFFCFPEDLSVVAPRVQTAINQSQQNAEAKEAFASTNKLYKSMNDELQRVSDENDALCNDLANAHCETEKKIKQVAIGAEFQTLVNQELEVESMLRTALGYMLTRIGAMNAAVYLREGETDWGVGAYINYDRQSEQFQTLIDTLGHAVCPVVACDTQVKRYKDGGVFAQVVDTDSVDFSGSEVVTVSCFHDDRCMAVIVLFRSDARPFNQENVETIETVREIFGTQLGTILKIHRRAETKWPSESIDDDDWSQGKAA